jgi:hypothetical protein
MGKAMVILRSVKDTAKARVTFQGPRRSLDQNARMWTALTCLSEQLPWYGQKLTPDDWKDVMSASLRKARVVPTIDGAGFVPLGMRTSDMSVAEMTALLDLMEAFAAERGVRFPWHEEEAA